MIRDLAYIPDVETVVLGDTRSLPLYREFLASKILRPGEECLGTFKHAMESDLIISGGRVARRSYFLYTATSTASGRR